MGKRYYTTEDVREELKRKIGERTLAEVAEEIGVTRTAVWQMARSLYPITGEVLSWLGYQRVSGLYEKL